MNDKRITKLYMVIMLLLVIAVLLLPAVGQLLAASDVTAGGDWGLLEPGQRIKIGCVSPMHIYAIPDGDSWLVVGCHD